VNEILKLSELQFVGSRSFDRSFMGLAERFRPCSFRCRFPSKGPKNMLRIVVDNSKPTIFRLFTCALASGIPGGSVRAMLDTLRDQSISLKLQGYQDDGLRDELKKSLKMMIEHFASRLADVAQLMRAGEQDIETLIDLARPLRARPQVPDAQPVPTADPRADDIIDVEYEVVEEIDAANDDGEMAVLYAKAA